MTFVAVDKSGDEWGYQSKPHRKKDFWDNGRHCYQLERGYIKKLIGIDLLWENEPFNLNVLKESECLKQ